MKTITEIPSMMQALELEAYTGWRRGLKLVSRPVPRPGPGEVLVRITAAPVNPADFAFMKGMYGVSKSLPTVPGWEGSGVVVAAGEGWYARYLLGKRVACAAPEDGGGTWAEYMVTPANRCIPLRRRVSDEQGAALLINPMTAWALVDLARRGGHRAVVQTAAAGALGRMIWRLGERRGLTMVNIVRRPEQVDLLTGLGAAHVLSTHEPDFDDRLKAVCRELGVTMAFDAVAGEMPDRLLAALPRRAEVVVYGALSNSVCQVNPGRLIFKDQRVRGFWVSRWRPRFGLPGQVYAGLRIQDMLAAELETPIQARLPLEKAFEGMEQYVKNMSAGKILLMPGGELSPR